MAWRFLKPAVSAGIAHADVEVWRVPAAGWGSGSTEKVFRDIKPLLDLQI